MSFHTSLKEKVVLVTGASAGIGLACAERFAAEGATVVMGARRADKLQTLATELSEKHNAKILPLTLDVTDAESCQFFIAESLDAFGKIDVLINNAGLALGKDTLATISEVDVRDMFETNVFGLLRLTRLALRHLLEQNAGHIINLGSVSGHDVYEGGGVYCATKFSVDAITRTLRYELLGKNIRVSEISPGLVETEFSLVRHRGDRETAAKTYHGMTPLSAQDIAECAVFIAAAPAHVNVDELILRPVQQAGFKVYRDGV
jgi:3-hydroxy acid dehydrogenase / malonic semialdehyde reductase